MVLTNVECNTCLGETLSVLDELQSHEQWFSFQMIGHAAHPSFLQKIIRMNRLSIPVYLDDLGVLCGELGIQDGPVIILYSNMTGRICYVFRPMPDVRDSLEKFRQVVLRLSVSS